MDTVPRAAPTRGSRRGGSPASQTFTVKNDGNSETINWAASVTAGSAWLSVSPSSGSTGASGQSVSVTANPGSLSPAT